MRKAIIGASLMVLATAGTAFAQSAEETVLFLVENLEAGPYDDGDSTGELKIVSEAPFELQLQNRRSNDTWFGYVQSAKVSKAGGCTFDVAIEYVSRNGGTTTSRQTWDFSRVEGFKVWGVDSYLAVEPRGFCKIEHGDGGAQQRKCEVHVSHGSKAIDRVQKAFAHLRANHCKARAF